MMSVVKPIANLEITPSYQRIGLKGAKLYVPKYIQLGRVIRYSNKTFKRASEAQYYAGRVIARYLKLLAKTESV